MTEFESENGECEEKNREHTKSKFKFLRKSVDRQGHNHQIKSLKFVISGIFLKCVYRTNLSNDTEEIRMESFFKATITNGRKFFHGLCCSAPIIAQVSIESFSNKNDHLFTLQFIFRLPSLKTIRHSLYWKNIHFKNPINVYRNNNLYISALFPTLPLFLLRHSH